MIMIVTRFFSCSRKQANLCEWLPVRGCPDWFLQVLAAGIATLFLLPLPVLAHTTVLIPLVKKGGGRIVRVVHFHPYSYSGLKGIRLGVSDTPDLKGLASIYMIHKGKKRSLKSAVRPDFLKIGSTRGETYSIILNRRYGFASGGDYVVVVVHQPHWKAAENLYRQKICKLYLNRGGMITDWPKRLLEKSPEIIPLVSPTEIKAGQVFRAEAVSDRGRPLSHARITIEYLSRIPGEGDLEVVPPAESLPEEVGDRTVFTDWQGNFSFIPPCTGLWTLTLVDGDEERQIEGHQLEYDSSISLLVN